MSISHKCVYPVILTLLICMLIPNISSIQWYERNNPHFINHQQFRQMVTNPQSRSHGVTFIKYMTPWCRYCRFLKQIFDQIKPQQKWDITFLDVNCDGENQQLCYQQHVRTYPHVDIFINGQLRQTIGGFYPYPVIKQFFVRYHQIAQSLKPPSNNLQPHSQEKSQKLNQNEIEPQIVGPEEHSHNNQAQKTQQLKNMHNKDTTQKQQKIQQHKMPVNVPSKHDQKPLEANKKPIQMNNQVGQQSKVKVPSQIQTHQSIQQKQNIVIVDQNKPQIQNQKTIITNLQKNKQTIKSILSDKLNIQSTQTNLLKYIIYAICIIVAAYYFINIMRANQSKEDNQPVRITRNTEQTRTLLNNKQQNKVMNFQMNQEIQFQHPQHQEQQQYKEIQIRDQDL